MITRRISTQKLIDFEKIAHEEDEPVTPKSGTSGLLTVPTLNMFGSLIKPTSDFMNPSKVSQIKTVMNPDNIFCASPVLSSYSTTNNIFVDIKEKDQCEEDLPQEGAKTPNFF